MTAGSGSPPDADLFDVVRAAIGVVLEVDPASVTAATSLADLGADSLARVGIADVVEHDLATRGWRLHIDDGALARMSTVDDVATYASSRRSPVPVGA